LLKTDIVYIITSKQGFILAENLTFFIPAIIKSISKKNRERESLADLVSKNNPSVNPRQFPAGFTKTLAIH